MGVAVEGQPEHRRVGPAFDIYASKLLCPSVRPGTIRNSPLVDGIARSRGMPIVSVVAPAGYGKTTFLSQWAERSAETFVWVSCDDADNDPKVLLTYVATALDAVQPVGERVFDALASPVSSVPGSVVPRLGSAFSAMTSPVVLVLDDVHVLHSRECRTAVSVLADHVPPGSRLAVSGRSEPPLQIARLRAEGRVFEVGAGQLSLSREQAATLLQHAGVALAAADVAVLHQRTEGWPVGLYLAALCLRAGGALPSGADSFGGDDRFVSDYIESEFLSRISREQRMFLTRTAVLDSFCGPLCDAVLDASGSAAMLTELGRSNLLLVPLDRRGEWYRYHHLFRDMLLAELERHEPGLGRELRRRAGDWYLRNGMPYAALDYFMAADDVDEVARLVEGHAIRANRAGMPALPRWLRWLDDRDGIARRPMLAVFTSIFYASNGYAPEADRWAEFVEQLQREPDAPADESEVGAWSALLQAMLCRYGVEQMRADADEAARRCAAVGIVAPAAQVLQGVAALLGGSLDDADAYLAEAATLARQVGAHETGATALIERAIVAITRQDWHSAERFADEARARLTGAGIEEGYISPLISAVHARIALRRGDVVAAQRELAVAQRLRQVQTYAMPYLAAQSRIHVAHARAAMADTAGARTLMREVDEVLVRRPELGTLVTDAQELRARLASETDSSSPGASTLTAAELRVLPLLATHLSFHEIADELFLSTHTVKSHGLSIYRKLDASGRSQAVARARELALLDGAGRRFS